MEVKRYRKRPVVIEAGRRTEDNALEIAHWINSYASDYSLIARVDGVGQLLIETLEGTHRADVGDWVIRGVQGEFYPCKPEIFDATYEPAELVGDDILHESDFEYELSALINSHNIDTKLNTPDFVLAAFVVDNLRVLKTSTTKRDKWWGFQPQMGGSDG